MDKPELLVMGVLPDWDLEPLAERYTLRLLYKRHRTRPAS